MSQILDGLDTETRYSLAMHAEYYNVRLETTIINPQLLSKDEFLELVEVYAWRLADHLVFTRHSSRNFVEGLILGWASRERDWDNIDNVFSGIRASKLENVFPEEQTFETFEPLLERIRKENEAYQERVFDYLLRWEGYKDLCDAGWGNGAEVTPRSKI